MRRGSATEQEVRVVYNPASGGAAGHTARDLRRELRDLRPELVVTADKGDAYEAARCWRRGLIVAAGGDGTVNEVVNGLGAAGFPEEVTLGVLPLGTGNDLAATLGMPARPEEAVPILLRAVTRKLDAARLRSEERELLRQCRGRGAGGRGLRGGRRQGDEAPLGQGLLPAGLTGGAPRQYDTPVEARARWDPARL
jgi:diacylglycerol kinase family enzyme